MKVKLEVKMKEFKAGFARVDITPQLGTPVVGYFEERRAKRILDPLEANALAVSDGDSTAVVIAADLLGIEGVSFNDTLPRRFGLLGRRIRGALVRVRFVCRRCSEGRSAGRAERSGQALLTGAAPCATMRGVLGHGVLKRCGMATD